MMIDWTKAPEGATHYMPFDSGPLWYDLRYQQVWQNDEWQPSELIRLGHLDWSKLVALPVDDGARLVARAMQACPYPGSETTKVDVWALYDAGFLCDPERD